MWGALNAESQSQLDSDAFFAPGRILGSHLSDQLPKVLARRGRPVGFDFQRQNSWNPMRCHRMSVSGFTFTSASRQLNIRLGVAATEWNSRPVVI